MVALRTLPSSMLTFESKQFQFDPTVVERAAVIVRGLTELYLHR